MGSPRNLTDEKLDQKAIPQKAPPDLPPQVDLKDLQKDGGLYSAEQWQKIAAALQGKKNLKLRRYYDKKTSAVREKMRILEDNEAKRILSETEKLELTLKLPHSVVVDSNGIPRVIYKDKLVDKGHFGKVKIQQNPQTKKFGVVKITKKICSTTRKENELSLKLKLGYGSFNRDANRSYLFMEYGGKDLKSLMCALVDGKVQLSFEERLNAAVKLFKALHILHVKYNILHRDIKPANILYNEKTKKLSFIDYGFSTDLPNSGYIYDKHMGTYDYLAPELRCYAYDYDYDYDYKYTVYTDIYAAGVTFAELFALVKERSTYRLQDDILKHPDLSINSAQLNTAVKIMAYISNHIIAAKTSDRHYTTQIIADLESIREEHIQELNKTCVDKNNLKEVMDRLILTQTEIDEEYTNEINLREVTVNRTTLARLVKAGADVNALSNSGVTALMNATRHGDIGTVTIMLSATNINVNHQGLNGYTALMFAIGGTCSTIVDSLLNAKDIDLHIRNDYGQTALTHVAHGCAPEILILIIAAYKKILPEKEFTDQVTQILDIGKKLNTLNDDVIKILMDALEKQQPLKPATHAQLGLFKAPNIADIKDEKKANAPVVLNLSLARPL